ncbi:DNA replication regulator SLD3 [Candida viswanathii]|uniref:DNA replication regulator SLD3 n=1 Tax=Candida viswanathii TaxID=5486 RepID=A0A367YFN9_9ASCO|nr:DNA replication regulator SLD3 [Candida viswanathii]
MTEEEEGGGGGGHHPHPSPDPNTSLRLQHPKTNTTTNITILEPIPTMSILPNYLTATDIAYFHNAALQLTHPHSVRLNDTHGVVFPVVNGFYGVFGVGDEPQDISTREHNGTGCMSVGTPSELINRCEKLSLGDHVVDTSRFSMRPPPAGGTRQDTPGEEGPGTREEIEEESSDPVEFLQRRYYSTLYSLKDPLSYFPKTALPRFRNLCCDSRPSAVESLRRFYLTVGEFDARHNHKYGVLSAVERLSGVEVVEQARFKTRNGFLIEEGDVEEEEEVKGISVEKLSLLILDLKIREAQLQIIVIFELLALLEIDEDAFLERNKKVQKKLEKMKENKAKLSLIGKNRRRKKKALDEKEEGEAETEEYSIYIALNNLIDRLSLWDTLSTTTDGAGTYGFMAYVLVPYFNKKLPHLMKYVIDNMKGLNMKLISSKRKKHEDQGSSSNQKKQKSTSKFKKVLLDKKPPTLSRSATIADSDDFKPLVSLKRSQSNLSTKMLSKREVDLNVKTKSEQPSSDSSSNQSFIFRSQLKRSKSTTTVLSTPSKPKFRKSLSQIEATPAKQRTLNMSQTLVKATPVKRPGENIFNPSSSGTHLAQVEATPDTSIHSPDTTPIDKFAKPGKRQNSFNDKLLSASKEVLVETTPQKSTTSNMQTTIIEATPGYAIGSSPLRHVGSSQTRPKPGEPMPLETSPLLKVLRDSESLMHNMKPVSLFNDQEYDSDELLNPKHTSKNTYSKRRR